MATIYRIENWEGFGPYSCIAPRFSYSAAIHPEPEFDGIAAPFDSSYSFGFESMRSLMLWFSRNEVETLNRWEQGWLVNKYEVAEEHRIVGRSQAVFQKDRAKLLGSMVLEELTGYERCDIDGELLTSLEEIFDLRAACVVGVQYPLLISISETTEELQELMESGSMDWLDESSLAGLACEEFQASVADALTELEEGAHYIVDYYLYHYRGGKLYRLEGSELPYEVELASFPATVREKFARAVPGAI